MPISSAPPGGIFIPAGGASLLTGAPGTNNTQLGTLSVSGFTISGSINVSKSVIPYSDWLLFNINCTASFSSDSFNSNSTITITGTVNGASIKQVLSIMTPNPGVSWANTALSIVTLSLPMPSLAGLTAVNGPLCYAITQGKLSSLSVSYTLAFSGFTSPGISYPIPYARRYH